MSDVVNTSTGTFSRGQDRPGSVPAPTCLKSAGFAPEGTHTQPETCPVCRRAARAGHRRVGGRHQHHRSAGSRLAAPIAAPALLRAIVDLARKFGLKPSTAMVWWLSTTLLAQIPPACLFWFAALWCDLAACLLARL